MRKDAGYIPCPPAECCGCHQVNKRQGADYQLQWRDTPDFVRMAAKTNALIIPFACVGGDDAYDVFMDTESVSCCCRRLIISCHHESSHECGMGYNSGDYLSSATACIMYQRMRGGHHTGTCAPGDPCSCPFSKRLGLQRALCRPPWHWFFELVIYC